MRITVKRTGGYAGLSEVVADVDTARLDAQAAERVEQSVRGANFFNLPAEGAGEAVGADMFHYEMTASDGGKSHTVAFSDGSPVAAPLLKLVEDLKRSA